MGPTIRAHFDGRVLVPDEPVNLPVNQSVQVQLEPARPIPPRLPPAERRAAWERFFARPGTAPYLSNESLRREYIYDDTY
jgi:hypothetical protein